MSKMADKAIEVYERNLEIEEIPMAVEQKTCIVTDCSRPMALPSAFCERCLQKSHGATDAEIDLKSIVARLRGQIETAREVLEDANLSDTPTLLTANREAIEELSCSECGGSDDVPEEGCGTEFTCEIYPHSGRCTPCPSCGGAS